MTPMGGSEVFHHPKRNAEQQRKERRWQSSYIACQTQPNQFLLLHFIQTSEMYMYINLASTLSAASAVIAAVVLAVRAACRASARTGSGSAPISAAAPKQRPHPKGPHTIPHPPPAPPPSPPPRPQLSADLVQYSASCNIAYTHDTAESSPVQCS